MLLEAIGQEDGVSSKIKYSLFGLSFHFRKFCTCFMQPLASHFTLCFAFSYEETDSGVMVPVHTWGVLGGLGCIALPPLVKHD